jgi:hypothetical protein
VGIQLVIQVTESTSALEIDRAHKILDQFRSSVSSVALPQRSVLEAQVRQAVRETSGARLLWADADRTLKGLPTRGPDVQAQLGGIHLQGMTRSLKAFFERTGIPPLIENRYGPNDAFPTYEMKNEVAQVVVELVREDGALL